MDDIRLTNLENQVASQGRLLQEMRDSGLSRDKILQEVRDSQLQITKALLGSIDSATIGLIEQARTTRHDLNKTMEQGQQHDDEIQDLKTFKADIKKIVAGIALLVPVAFEILKGLATGLWQLLRNSPINTP